MSVLFVSDVEEEGTSVPVGMSKEKMKISLSEKKFVLCTVELQTQCRFSLSCTTMIKVCLHLLNIFTRTNFHCRLFRL